MLQPLSHLAAAVEPIPEIRFRWDDWNTEAVEERPDEPLVQAIRLMSDRAAIALATAMAEWVEHRFSRFIGQAQPRQLIEAAWASGADWKYQAQTWEAVGRSQSWHGAVRGPLGAAMMALDYALEVARLGGDVSVGARWISNIATHVLPDPSAFLEWREAVTVRLIALFPRSMEDEIGDAVPREVLDLSRDFDVREIEPLINRLLHDLDYHDHPFLAGPEDLARAGFKSRPYVFDVSRDRVERRFW